MHCKNFSHRLSPARRRKAYAGLCLAVCLGLSACGSWGSTDSMPGDKSSETSLTGQESESDSSTADSGIPESKSDDDSTVVSPEQYLSISDKISVWMAIMPDGAIFFHEKDDIAQWAPKLLALNTEDNPIAKLRSMLYLQRTDSGRELISGVLAIRQDGSAWLDGDPILQDTLLNDACYFANDGFMEELFDKGCYHMILAAPKEGELFLYDPETDQRYPLGISNVTRITNCISLTSTGAYVLQHDDLTYEMFCVNPHESLEQLDASCLDGAVSICAMSDFTKLYETPSLAENAADVQRETFVLAGLKADGTVVGNANVPKEVLDWQGLFHLAFVYRSMSSPGYERDTYENAGFIGLRNNQPMLMSGRFPYYINGRDDGSGNFAVPETETVIAAHAFGSGFNSNFCFYTGYHNPYGEGRIHDMWRGIYSDGHLFAYMIAPDGTAYKYNRDFFHWSKNDKWLNP